MSATAGANPYRAPDSNITPTGYATATDFAGRGTRLAAVILDGLIQLAFMLPGVLVITLGMEGAGSASANPLEMVAGLGGILLVAGLLVWGVVTFRLVADNGWTLGKRICGIRVVRSDGSPASVGRIFFLRNVIVVLLSMVPIVGLFVSIGDPLMIFGERRQCLHDRFGDTIVVQA